MVTWSRKFRLTSYRRFTAYVSTCKKGWTECWMSRMASRRSCELQVAISMGQESCICWWFTALLKDRILSANKGAWKHVLWNDTSLEILFSQASRTWVNSSFLYWTCALHSLLLKYIRTIPVTFSINSNAVKKRRKITIRTAVVTAEVQDIRINSRDKNGLLQIRSNDGNCNQQHTYKVQSKLHSVLHHKFAGDINQSALWDWIRVQMAATRFLEYFTALRTSEM